jgi:hypothetical protein
MSCNDISKQQKKNQNSDTTKPKADNIKAQVEDSSKIFVDIGFIKPAKIEATDKLKKCVKGIIESVETIDFTGDKITDYICRTKPGINGIGKEYWVSSDYRIIKNNKYGSYGFLYRWFINLDNDLEPEFYEASGDEDGADYLLKDQNLATGKDTTLLYINPVVIENGKKYWGYPWNITNIKARTNGRTVELFCSLNHKLTRDGNEENHPEHQTQMPVLFFTGHPSQDSDCGNIENEQWLTLQEIIKRTKK